MKTLLYEIRVKNGLDAKWKDLFEGLSIEPEEGGITRICGPVADQAMLHGILERIRDLNLTLISVTEKGTERR